MLKNDKWIIKQARNGMITPFTESLIREVKVVIPGNLLAENPTNPNSLLKENALEITLASPTRRVISYGVDSYGYDLTLSPGSFKVFRHTPGTVINPKRFNEEQNLEAVELKENEDGQYFILPGHSYGLGFSTERIAVPDNITVLCLGKSTYARVGVIANITPFEAGWQGYPTLEFSNSSEADCMIFANEGVVKMMFLEGEPCMVTYADRGGKYQNQPARIVTSRV